MDYFTTPPHLITRTQLTIEGEEFVHLTHVMRKHVGDAIVVVDGKGSAYDVMIEAIEKSCAFCTIRAHQRMAREPEIDVTLAVGLLKNSSNFDFLVEKTVEIGVNTVIPILTGRTIPRHARTDRWQKIALAAMKQSGRCVLPEVHPLTSLNDILSSTRHGRLRLIPHEKTDTRHIADVLKPGDFTSVLICIGPEGGFTDDEIDTATRSGFVPVSLGPRRLRTETAAIVAASSVLLR